MAVLSSHGEGHSCVTRWRDGPEPAGEQREPAQQPEHGMTEEGSGPMFPAGLPTPSLAPYRCKAAVMSLHHQNIL